MIRWLMTGGAGLCAGALNAVAGGGSFVSVPALLALGVPSVTANATSAVALWPGSIASVWVYRDGLRPVAGMSIGWMGTVTLIGGVAGAVLLLATPAVLFDKVLPWLLLMALAALALGPRIAAAAGDRQRIGHASALALQLSLGVYGGYYGGAVGLMMLALWSLIDRVSIKALNAPRTLMVAIANSGALLCFVLAGAVRWTDGLPLGAGAIAGGYGGARLGRVLPPRLVRWATLSFCGAITGLLFVRAYH